jgi:transmembrane sensor
VRAAINEQRREFWLDQGEAYFEVAHREGTPFVVRAGNRHVTVLGTKFSVRRDGDDITVSVLEGRIQIDEMKGARAVRSTVVTSGDIVRTSGAATLVTARSNERVASALAWREGMLNFDQARLSDIAAEFNRYNRKPIFVTDAEAASIRIGGMFPANDPDAFARLLRDAYGLRVEETQGEIRISS